jgi:hypothetical protein
VIVALTLANKSISSLPLCLFASLPLLQVFTIADAVF